MKESREYIPKELQELFVPYIIAWKLQHYDSKEQEAKNRALFNTECIAFWNHYQEVHFNHTYNEYAQHLKAPMYDQVVSWLESKNIFFDSLHTTQKYYEYSVFINVGECTNNTSSRIGKKVFVCCEKTRILALNKCIEEAIKLI